MSLCVYIIFVYDYLSALDYFVYLTASFVRSNDYVAPAVLLLLLLYYVMLYYTILYVGMSPDTGEYRHHGVIRSVHVCCHML